MIKGNSVGLTAIEKSDLETLRNWRNNPEFRKYFREYRELNTVQQEIWFEQKVLNDPSTIMFSIRKIPDSDLIGCCGLAYINWVHRHADLSLYIGLDDSYIDKKGYAHESCALLFQYGFDQLGLNKIWTEIYEFDYQKKELYEQLGLKVDGVLRENYFYDGRWWNSLIYSVTASDYHMKGIK